MSPAAGSLHLFAPRQSDAGTWAQICTGWEGHARLFSRQVVGWLITERESSELAKQLIADSVACHDIEPGMLTPHADRGAAMRSKPVAALRLDLDIAKSRGRPHVSDDNLYLESQLKTMKYRQDFAARFACIEDARLDVAFLASPIRLKGR